MTPVRRQRMFEDMQLRGLAPARRAATSRPCSGSPATTASLPTRHRRRAPAHFLDLINERHVAPAPSPSPSPPSSFSTSTPCSAPGPSSISSSRANRAPCPPSSASTRSTAWLSALRQPHHRVCPTTIHAAGLRLNEGVFLRVAQIDSARIRCCISRCQRRQRPLRPPPAPRSAPRSAIIGAPTATRSISSVPLGADLTTPVALPHDPAQCSGCPAGRRPRMWLPEACQCPYCTAWATHLPKPASICARSRSGSATARRPPPCATPTSPPSPCATTVLIQIPDLALGNEGSHDRDRWDRNEVS